MQTIGFSERMRYRFDNVMAKGPIALIGWLGILSVVLIVVITGVVEILGLDPDGRGFLPLAWAGLMRTLDAGTMGGDTGSWPYLLLMLATTMGGIFIVSTLIGILSSGLEGKLEELRKGRSFVAEQGHTIILGWSSQIFTLVSELVLANENQPSSCIVIMADKDVVEMQDEIRSKVGSTGRTRIVYRTGSLIDVSDLAIVNPDAAKSIVILPPEESNPDAAVIKSILALVRNPKRSSKSYHVVTFIRDAKNWDVARMVGGNEVEIVLSSDLVARITAQTCRQSGLSVAYLELLDYGGDEIYFKEEPILAGKNFGEALSAYDDSAVIGMRSQSSGVQLNPPMEQRIEEGDQMIVIAADDDRIKLALNVDKSVDHSAIRKAVQRQVATDHTLILGWNERGSMILDELDEYVAVGSNVKVIAASREQVNGIAKLSDLQNSISMLPNGASPMDSGSNGTASLNGSKGHHFQNLKINFEEGDITERSTLESVLNEGYEHVIVLSEATEEATDTQHIDARTLITLLHLRDIVDKNGNGAENGSAPQHEKKSLSIVSEMLDVRNRELAHVARADDFVVSDKLLSLLMAQISENKELAAVFQDLFDPEGSELYFKPMADYVELGKPVNFYTVLESARQRGEVAIGYRLQKLAYEPDKAYGVKLNPIKSQLVTYSTEDRVIVLAEN